MTTAERIEMTNLISGLDVDQLEDSDPFVPSFEFEVGFV
jgi:hypothetical protein